MVQPIVIPRDQHTLSRRDIDPDALKVLYRLHNGGYTAYLVGGSVRDLLLGRRPKDFDIGTDAHPYQIKRLFRNCWIIGRRFRLAHVRFGTKIIEVATFRRQVPAGTEEEPPLPHAEQPLEPPEAGDPPPVVRVPLVHRDNTFGTPEEDAFRRDFTVNALFYDIATFSIIDYVGGLDDLRHGLIRSIGNPDQRFLEDPVRMLRAIVLSARLGLTLDPPVFEAIAQHRWEIAKASPARVLEEYYKILRSGAALKSMQALGESRLLEVLSPELPSPLPAAVERSLAALDMYRQQFTEPPDALTNALLLGSLIVPLGILNRRRRRTDGDGLGEREPLPRLGMLPLARRDVERLTRMLALQRRLVDLEASPRAQLGLLHRTGFPEALTWLDMHGARPDVVAHWNRLRADTEEERPAAAAPAADGETPWRPRRRRRRGRRSAMGR